MKSKYILIAVVVLIIAKIIWIMPTNAESYFGYGYQSLRLGKYEQAIELFDLAIEEDPMLSYAYVFRAEAKGHLGMYQEADIDRDIATQVKRRGSFIRTYRWEIWYALWRTEPK